MTEPSIKTADDCRSARLESDCPRYQAQVLHDAEQEIRRLHKRIEKLEKAGVPERKQLTDEQIDAIQDKHMHIYPATPRRFARMIEAAHGIGKDVP